MTWREELREKAVAFSALLEKKQNTCGATTYIRTHEHRCQLQREHGGPHYDQTTMKHWAVTCPINSFCTLPKGHEVDCAEQKCSSPPLTSGWLPCTLVKDHEGNCNWEKECGHFSSFIPMSTSSCSLPVGHSGSHKYKAPKLKRCDKLVENMWGESNPCELTPGHDGVCDDLRSKTAPER